MSKTLTVVLLRGGKVVRAKACSSIGLGAMVHQLVAGGWVWDEIEIHKMPPRLAACAQKLQLHLDTVWA